MAFDIIDLPRQISPKGSTAQPERIAKAVFSLLSHYWTANDPAEIREAQAADWLEDLIEFPAQQVMAACRQWRRTSNRRPTPYDIRSLCFSMSPRSVEA